MTFIFQISIQVKNLGCVNSPFENICVQILAVSKRTTHRVHVERFSLKKLNEIYGKKHCNVEISNRFTILENLDAKVDVNRTWETVRENVKISAKESKLLGIEEA
jgi:hypothetical protein